MVILASCLFPAVLIRTNTVVPARKEKTHPRAWRGRGLLLANLPSFPRDPDQDTIRFWPSESNTPFIASQLTLLCLLSVARLSPVSTTGWLDIDRSKSQQASRSFDEHLSQKSKEESSVRFVVLVFGCIPLK